jgi:hypothetical protein
MKPWVFALIGGPVLHAARGARRPGDGGLRRPGSLRSTRIIQFRPVGRSPAQRFPLARKVFEEEDVLPDSALPAVRPGAQHTDDALGPPPLGVERLVVRVHAVALLAGILTLTGAIGAMPPMPRPIAPPGPGDPSTRTRSPRCRRGGPRPRYGTVAV